MSLKSKFIFFTKKKWSKTVHKLDNFYDIKKTVSYATSLTYATSLRRLFSRHPI